MSAGSTEAPKHADRGAVAVLGAARQQVDRDELARDAVGVVGGMLGAGFLVRSRG